MSSCEICRSGADCGSVLHPDGAALPGLRQEIAWGFLGLKIDCDYDAVACLMGVFSLDVPPLGDVVLTAADLARMMDELRGEMPEASL